MRHFSEKCLIDEICCLTDEIRILTDKTLCLTDKTEMTLLPLLLKSFQTPIDTYIDTFLIDISIIDISIIIDIDFFDYIN